MMFRRLYWVTEQHDKEGWRVTGVYTSCSDLVDRGLRFLGGQREHDGFRISLVKLDSANAPIGAWSGREFDRLFESLAPYIETGEFTQEECVHLQHAVTRFLSPVPR